MGSKGKLSKALEVADPNEVVAAMRRVAANAIPQGRWLAEGNRYAEGKLLANVEEEHVSGVKDAAGLAETIAASTALHVADAWNYAGRALNAHAHGDADTAIHLAYYAELRAAMGILAACGVGVCKSHQVQVGRVQGQPTTQVSKLGPTHDFVWRAFEHSRQSRRAADLVCKGISVGGYNVSQWLTAFRATGIEAATAAEWFQRWGLDLRQFARDSRLRNKSSYEPNRFDARAEPSGEDLADTLHDIWNPFEPQPNDRFASVDIHLLHFALQWGYEATTDAAHRSQADYLRRLDEAIKELAPPAVTSIRAALVDYPAKPPAIFSFAANATPPGAPQVAIVSRAWLLTRLATAIAKSLLDAAHLDREALSFWWRPYGLTAGLWRPDQEPDSFDELWKPIKASLNDVDSWLLHVRGRKPPASCAEWRADSSRYPHPTLFATESVALWGLIA